MALTADEEQEIRKLLAKERAQEQELIKASKSSFKTWLKRVCSYLVARLTEAAINALFARLFGG